MWSDVVAPRDFEDFQQLEEKTVVQEIVCLGSSMGLEMNKDDVEELVEDHRKEPVKFHNEEAQALKQRISVRDVDDEEKEKVTAFRLRNLKRCSLTGINCPNL